MGHVIFNKESYEYERSGVFSAFYSDERHDYLLDYVDKDLSDLPKLFVQYISERIDTKTMNIKTLTPEECKKNEDRLNDIIETMKTAHPYYEHEYKDIIINGIANYFIDLLLIYTGFNEPVTEEFFDERIEHLTLPILSRGISYSNTFYEKYKKMMGKEKITLANDNGDIQVLDMTTFIWPADNPMIVETITQKTIYDMLYFILDMDAQNLEELTTSQRIWLYNKTHPFKKSVYVNKQLSYQHSHYDVGTVPNKSMDDVFYSLYSHSEFDIGRTGIPEDIMEDFKLAVEYAKRIKDYKIYEKYEINSLKELLYLEVMSMIQSETMIRKCKNCGRYFVVNHHNTQYCNRKNESGKPCSIVGPRKSFNNKMEDNDVWDMYKKAYNTHYHRRKGKGNKKMTAEEFSKWGKIAKEKYDQVVAGKLSKDEFQAWLKE